MNRILFTILFTFLTLIGFSQTFPITQAIGGKTTNVRTEGTLGSLTGFTFMKIYADTLEANSVLYVKYTPGILIATADYNTWIRNSTVSAWIKTSGGGGGGSGFTTASNGLTASSSSNVILGGSTISQYTPITLSANPIQIIHNGISSNAQTDSNGLKLASFSTWSSATDSFRSPQLIIATTARKTFGGVATQPVEFYIDALGKSSTGALADLYFRSRTNNGSYVTAFKVSTSGVFNGALLSNGQSPLNIDGSLIGNSAGGFYIGSSSQQNAISGAAGLLSIGKQALQDVTTGIFNIAIGETSLNHDTTGSYNIAIGYGALGNNDSMFNVAIGYSAMIANTLGHSNTAIGTNSLVANTIAIKNTAIGAGSLENTTTGGFNTGLGEDVLLHNITGTDNIGIGWLSNSLETASVGSIGIGNSSWRSRSKGNYSIAIGHQAGYLNSQVDSCESCILIGANTYATTDHMMVLGDTALTSTYLRGVANTGTTSDAVLVQTTNGQVKSIAQSSIVGATPTLQQVITAGGNLTGTNVIDVGSGSDALSIKFNGGGGRVNISQSSTFLSGPSNSSITLQASGSILVGKTDEIDLGDSTRLKPYLGKLNIDSLRSGSIDTTTYKPLAWSSARGDVVQMNSWAQVSGGGSSGITVGTTTITSGTNGRYLYDNSGVVGEGIIGFGLSGTSTLVVDSTKFLYKLAGTNITGANQFLASQTFNPGTTTGTTTSSGVVQLYNALTSGTGEYITSSSLTSGNLLQLTSTSTALAAGNEGIDINFSGANGTNAITATGLRISVTNTNATSGTNIGADITATGATTQNIALKVTGPTGSSTGYAAQFTGRIATGGVTAPFADIDNGNGTLATGSITVTTSAGTNQTGNFSTGSQGLVGTNTGSIYQFLGSSTAQARGYFGGTGATALTAGTVYGTVLIGAANVPRAASGTTPIIASIASLAPGITGTSGTVTDATNVYISGRAVTTATNATTALFVDNGIVRIDDTLALGTGAPTAQLHTTGTVRFATFGAGALNTDASGNVSAVSDIRLKYVQGDYTFGLDEVMKITPILYKWRPKSGMETEHIYAGFSAQNVRDVLGDYGTGINKEGYYSLQDRAIMATMLNAIKELNEKIVYLESKIKK